MKYDFTSMIDRRGRDANAVDNIGRRVWGYEPTAPRDGFDAIPMWVADMNFATAPAVTDALRERIAHPLFGYFVPRPEYARSIIRWQEERHRVTGLTEEAIGYENGVHGFVTSCVETLSRPGEAVFMHAPYYVGFCQDVEGLGRVPIRSELVRDAAGVYRMDYADMDARLKAANCHLAILCSPHNPTGRVWERWELEKAVEVFERNEVLVISDEIWADIAYTGYRHIPTQMVNEWARQHTLAAYAPSKTFNLAGLIGSYHIIYNKYLRDRVVHCGSRTHYNEMNVLSMHALIGAYSDGGAEWTGELMQVLEQNCRFVSRFLNSVDGVSATDPEGTYMIFADCTLWCKAHGMTLDELLRAGWDVGVGWQDGRFFGGPCHIRLNAASPFSRIQEAMNRLDKYVFHA